MHYSMGGGRGGEYTTAWEGGGEVSGLQHGRGEGR